MEIKKFKKDKSNKYKVLIDDEEYTLYDDVIVKYELILKREISNSLFDEIIKYNNELDSYYLSIKYITKKLRCEKEVREYLKKYHFDNKIIDKTIKKLRDNNFIDDDAYLKAYINDQILLTNNGKLKIYNNLIKLDLSPDLISVYLDNINQDIWIKKINKYIEKKIKANHTSSSYMLKVKIKNDLINLGYESDDVTRILNNYEVNDDEVLKRETKKAKKDLEKKYTGYELKQKIRMRLYRKGFKVYEIEGEGNEE